MIGSVIALVLVFQQSFQNCSIQIVPRAVKPALLKSFVLIDKSDTNKVLDTLADVFRSFKVVFKYFLQSCFLSPIFGRREKFMLCSQSFCLRYKVFVCAVK